MGVRVWGRSSVSWAVWCGVGSRTESASAAKTPVRVVQSRRSATRVPAAPSRRGGGLVCVRPRKAGGGVREAPQLPAVEGEGDHGPAVVGWRLRGGHARGPEADDSASVCVDDARLGLVAGAREREVTVRAVRGRAEGRILHDGVVADVPSAADGGDERDEGLGGALEEREADHKGRASGEERVDVGEGGDGEEERGREVRQEAGVGISAGGNEGAASCSGWGRVRARCGSARGAGSELTEPREAPSRSSSLGAKGLSSSSSKPSAASIGTECECVRT
jgi:hypothetical protein